MFLSFAKRILLNRIVPEEECRSAISRAYYSLYHQTGDTLRKRYSLTLLGQLKKQISPRKRRTINWKKLNRLEKKYILRLGLNLHKAYRNALLASGFRKEATLFGDFRIKRNQADYDLYRNFNKSDTKDIVQEIEKLFNLIQTL